MNGPIRLALLAILLVAADIPAPPVEGDREKIQGAWVMVGREADGQADDPAALNKQAVMVFEGNKVLVRMGNRVAELGSFALDPTKAPKSYDRVYSDGTPRRGIYALEGDSLKICLAEIGKPRPTAFATRAGDGNALLTYRRESPEGASNVQKDSR